MLGSLIDLGAAGFKLGAQILRGNQADKFDKRFKVITKNVTQTTKDIVSFKKEQYSFNLRIKKQQAMVTEKIEKIEENILHMTVYEEVSEILQEIIDTSMVLDNYSKSLLNGAILASRGIPTLPFVEPKAVSQVMEVFEKEIFLRKPSFQKKTFMKFIK